MRLMMALCIFIFSVPGFAQEDDLLPEEVQGQTAPEPQQKGASSPNQKASPKNASATAEGQQQDSIGVQNVEVLSLIDGMQFGKEQFLPSSAFVKEGKLTSSLLK